MAKISTSENNNISQLDLAQNSEGLLLIFSYLHDRDNKSKHTIEYRYAGPTRFDIMYDIWLDYNFQIKTVSDHNSFPPKVTTKILIITYLEEKHVTYTNIQKRGVLLER